MPRLRSSILAAALACLTTSCSDGTGVGKRLAALAGDYSLRSIDGQPLPRVVAGKWVLELTLTLTTDERVILIGYDYPQNVPGGPAPPPTFREFVSVGGRFDLHDDLILLHAGNRVYVREGSGDVALPDSIRVDANAGSSTQPLWIRYLYVRTGR